MKSQSIITLLFVSLLVSQAIAQTDSEKLSEQYFLEGMEAYNFTHRTQASQLFMLAVQANPNNAKANFMAGKSIMEAARREQSLPYYLKALKLDPNIDEDILFFIGQAYHYNEQFDSALHYYNRFSQVLSRALRFERSMKISEVNWKIFECNNARVYKDNPVKVTIVDLDESINSEFPDYAPTISADERMMVFTTRRPDKNNNPTLAQDMEYYEEIHISKKENGKWQPSVNLGGPLNSAFHNASVSLSPDGTEMFMYKDENGGDIYETDIQPDNTWARPKRLNGFINSPYLENAASVTFDKKQLYFVSDRPGGYGGSDIYMASQNKRGEWSVVQNLGPVINTSRDEEDVYVSASGKHLYFSSNGHAGMGDLDIYRSTYDPVRQQWGEPMNLGYPINSVENDFYFALNGDERYAYLSSIRDESKGDEDIYRVDLVDWTPITREELLTKESQLTHPAGVDVSTPAVTGIMPSSTELIVKTMDAGTGGPLLATVVLMDDSNKEIPVSANPDGTHQAKLGSSQSMKYRLRVSADGYKPYTSTVHFIGQSAGANLITETILLQKEEKKITRVLYLYHDLNQESPKNEDDLLMVLDWMKENPSAKITISSHTDANGDEAYNLELSRRRAEAAKKYLIKSGIDPSRIQALGFGESQPRGDNSTYQGRKASRRTELVIE